MKNNNIYDVIRSNGCIEGGTYEAYIKAREVVLNCIDAGDKLLCVNNSVSMTEFIQAVKVLMTFASKHNDEHVQLYYCDRKCKFFKTQPCPGDCMLSENSTIRCPFYR